MNKTTITRRIAIAAPKEKVWAALADFGNVQNLSPNIASSRSTSDQKQDVGATRHCDFVSMGAHVEERITEWKEGESMRIDIYETNMPMVTGMEAEFAVYNAGNGTSLEGTFRYGMKNALGNILNALTMKRMNEKAWDKFMAGIKHYSETGETVDQKTKLDLASVEVPA